MLRSMYIIGQSIQCPIMYIDRNINIDIVDCLHIIFSYASITEVFLNIFTMYCTLSHFNA